MARPNATDSFAHEMHAGCLASRVGRLHRIVARRYELALAPVGLTPPQLEVLAAMTVAAHAVTPSALAGVLGVERSTMSRNLALMQDRGWIEAAEVSPGGRAMKVAVTREGRAAFRRARGAWAEAQQEVAAALGEDAVEGLDAWLAGLGWQDPSAAPATAR